MPTSYDSTLLDHLAEHMVYLLMLAAADNVGVNVIVVSMVILADVIVPVVVIMLVFVLRRPLALSLRRLDVACCFTSVAGIFASRPSFG
jgi:hypothetical protein